ncbi:MAG: hypothetical protein WCJ74_01475, partial [bacterium]
MRKTIFIIILFFLLLISGIIYCIYLSNIQVVNSEKVFDNKTNFFPFGTTSSQTVALDQISTTTKNTPAKSANVTIPTQGIRIVTNGITDPKIDPQHKSQTAYQQDGKSLDATTDNYVTVPKNTVPIGSRVYILDQNTGLDIWGVVGDIGPYGGISLYAVEQL